MRTRPSLLVDLSNWCITSTFSWFLVQYENITKKIGTFSTSHHKPWGGSINKLASTVDQLSIYEPLHFSTVHRHGYEPTPPRLNGLRQNEGTFFTECLGKETVNRKCWGGMSGSGSSAECVSTVLLPSDAESRKIDSLMETSAHFLKAKMSPPERAGSLVP